MIRVANLEDAEAIAKVQVVSSQYAYKDIFSEEYLDKMSISNRKNIWEDIIIKNDTEICVVEIDSIVKGYIHFGPTRDTDNLKNTTCELMSIYIYPDYQRHGFGQSLFNMMCMNLSPDFKQLNVWVLNDNIPAKNFYEKMGFYKDKSKEIEADGKKLVEVRYIKSLS